MATRKNDRKQEKIILRNASDPYTLHLGDDPYILTSDMLWEQTDARIQRKRTWAYPKLKFISFESGILQLQNIDHLRKQEMTVKIEPDKMHVSCDCGTEVETLCVHVYKALEWITSTRRPKYFEKFRPNGLVEIAKAHKKYFKIKSLDFELNIPQKGNLGDLYLLSDGPRAADFLHVMKLPEAILPESNGAGTTALSYILMDPFMERYLPFLFPCFGTLNKAGNDIKWFLHAAGAAGQKYDRRLTTGQKELNKICHEMTGEVNKFPGPLVGGSSHIASRLSTLFSLWEKALPLLHLQQLIYMDCLYGNPEHPGKPLKTNMQKIRIGRERPRISFKLTEKGEFYQLQMKVRIKEKLLKNAGLDTTFFARHDQTLYLLSSLKDAGIAKWMNKSGNLITIFKEHFSEFENTILAPVRSCYPVETVLPTVRNRSGKAKKNS